MENLASIVTSLHAASKLTTDIRAEVHQMSTNVNHGIVERLDATKSLVDALTMSLATLQLSARTGASAELGRQVEKAAGLAYQILEVIDKLTEATARVDQQVRHCLAVAESVNR
jgi:methyl-accepting chemotaxis protein